MSFPLIKLGDLFEIQIGKTPSRANQNYWTNGLYNWLSIADMNQGKYLDRTKEKINDLAVKESNIKLIPENTVVLSYKLSIGKVGITKKSMFTNEAIASLIPLNNNIDINFLYWALQHIDLMANTDRAAMGQTLNKAKLKEIKIPLPSLSEQKRIAEILDKADELRQKRQQSIEKLDELLQATFIDMFGDPVTNPNKHKTDILANYVLKDFQNGLYKPASFYGSGTPILRIDGYRNGDIINESNFKRLELEPSEIEKYKLTKMDLVINRVNSPEYLGKIALFMDDREDTVFESNMMRFSIRQELLNVYYLIFLFKQRYISNQIATKRKDAVNQSSINQQDVKSLILNVPNIKLQNKWAELYQSCNMQKKILTSQLNQQETLFQSLQQRAFNGEL